MEYLIEGVIGILAVIPMVILLTRWWRRREDPTTEDSVRYCIDGCGHATFHHRGGCIMCDCENTYGY